MSNFIWVETDLEKGEQIPGGLAEGKKDSEFDAAALAAGMKVEMEHTKDPKVAREIAKDHLTEDPNYYKKLKKIEKSEDEEEEEEEEEKEAEGKKAKKEASDAEAKAAVKNFLAKNPKPEDEQIHALAGKLGMDPDDLEEKIYAMLGKKIKKSAIDELGEYLEKAHKYIKRTGTPGNYKYWYKDASGKMVSTPSRGAAKKDETKKIADKIGSSIQHELRQENRRLINEGITLANKPSLTEAEKKRSKEIDARLKVLGEKLDPSGLHEMRAQAEKDNKGADEHEGIMRRMKVGESVVADSEKVAKKHGTSPAMIANIWHRLQNEKIIEQKNIGGVAHMVRTSKIDTSDIDAAEKRLRAQIAERDKKKAGKTIEVMGDTYPDDSKYARQMAENLAPPEDKKSKSEWAAFRDWAKKHDVSKDDMKAMLDAHNRGDTNAVTGGPMWSVSDVEAVARRLGVGQSKREQGKTSSGKEQRSGIKTSKSPPARRTLMRAKKGTQINWTSKDGKAFTAEKTDPSHWEVRSGGEVVSEFAGTGKFDGLFEGASDFFVEKSESAIDALGDYLEKSMPSDTADITPEKARQILHDGTVHGKPLTEQQRKFFGAIASKGKAKKSMTGLDDLRKACQADGEPMSKGMVGGYGIEWANRMMGSPFEVDALQCISDLNDVNIERSRYRKTHDKSWDAKRRMDPVDRARFNQQVGEAYEKFDRKENDIRLRMDEVERKYLNWRIDQAKGMNKSTTTEKSMSAVDDLREHLEKSGEMPTGQPTGLNCDCANGGPVEGKGKNSGSGHSANNDKDQDEKGNPTGVPTPVTQDWSLEAEARRVFHGVNTMKSVGGLEQDRAVAESRLRKGQEDIHVHPYSMAAVHGDTNARAERLAKGGANPENPSNAVIHQEALCKSCGHKHPAMLTSCPHCGDGSVGQQQLSKSNPGFTLDEPRGAPILQRPKVAKDILIKG